MKLFKAKQVKINQFQDTYIPMRKVGSCGDGDEAFEDSGKKWVPFYKKTTKINNWQDRLFYGKYVEEKIVLDTLGEAKSFMKVRLKNKSKEVRIKIKSTKLTNI